MWNTSIINALDKRIEQELIIKVLEIFRDSICYGLLERDGNTPFDFSLHWNDQLRDLFESIYIETQNGIMKYSKFLNEFLQLELIYEIECKFIDEEIEMDFYDENKIKLIRHQIDLWAFPSDGHSIFQNLAIASKKLGKVLPNLKIEGGTKNETKTNYLLH